VTVCRIASRPGGEAKVRITKLRGAAALWRFDVAFAELIQPERTMINVENPGNVFV
jgi:hypothetical protein